MMHARPDKMKYVWYVCNWSLNCSLNSSSCLMYAFRQTHLQTNAKYVNNSQWRTSHFTATLAQSSTHFCLGDLKLNLHKCVQIFLGVCVCFNALHAVLLCCNFALSIWKSLLVDSELVYCTGYTAPGRYYVITNHFYDNSRDVVGTFGNTKCFLLSRRNLQVLHCNC